MNIDVKREKFEFSGLDANKTYEQNLMLLKKPNSQ